MSSGIHRRQEGSPPAPKRTYSATSSPPTSVAPNQRSSRRAPSKQRRIGDPPDAARSSQVPIVPLLSEALRSPEPRESAVLVRYDRDTAIPLWLLGTPPSFSFNKDGINVEYVRKPTQDMSLDAPSLNTRHVTHFTDVSRTTYPRVPATFDHQPRAGLQNALHPDETPVTNSRTRLTNLVTSSGESMRIPPLYTSHFSGQRSLQETTLGATYASNPAAFALRPSSKSPPHLGLRGHGRSASYSNGMANSLGGLSMSHRLAAQTTGVPRAELEEGQIIEVPRRTVPSTITPVSDSFGQSVPNTPNSPQTPITDSEVPYTRGRSDSIDDLYWPPRGSHLDLQAGTCCDSMPNPPQVLESPTCESPVDDDREGNRHQDLNRPSFENEEVAYFAGHMPDQEASRNGVDVNNDIASVDQDSASSASSPRYRSLPQTVPATVSGLSSAQTAEVSIYTCSA